MTGVVLETLSTKKLIAFYSIVLIFHAVFFLLGGLIAPAPNTSDQILTTKCIDRSSDPLNNKKWFFTRPVTSNHSCEEILPEGDLSEVVPAGVDANQIVFVAQFPLPRNDYDLKMTKWFQQMVAILMLDIKYKSEFEALQDSSVSFHVRLGYRNHGDGVNEWKELAHSLETRPLSCKLDPDTKKHAHNGQDKSSSFFYDCEILPLFTLGSVHYDYYLVNIRIPSMANKNINTHLGLLQDIWMVEIHQNGGFTKVWFALKTVMFPVTLAALIFFWRRVLELERRPTFLERTTLTLGVVISILNLPIEWLSLVINVPFWLVLSDLRQGAFYATLVCFWLVFTGEHSMGGGSNDSPGSISLLLEKLGLSKQYWSKLILVAGASCALFIFELAERGVQLRNPFYSIWSHPNAARMGFGTMIVGSVCAVVYFIYLAYLVTKALLTMLDKRRRLHTLPDERRLFYSGVIYRFSTLLAYTALCALLTVVFFICSQLNEDQWKWGEHSLEYSSAFITGVYGMWNIYVCSVLCLYAPSRKYQSDPQMFQQLIDNDNENEDSQSGAVQMQVIAGAPPDGFKFIQKTAFE
ncbi:hypothetical protein Ciccas_007669 [Cichlidogyrus casuarinus]|uniref:Protein wntless homolog n=1 Tax=Cichlidogyrus casuarinus TaxID=1844966 RepID=A0ABD2Q286_9PLAT